MSNEFSQTEQQNTQQTQPQTLGDAESYNFQAEISQLLSIIINTFYSNKEIFLRELVSNASDAMDKLRYQCVHSNEGSNLLGNEQELRIRIIPDSVNNCLIIEDTGIGMTRDDLVNNLGTIARSGTREFMQQLTSGGDMSLIGQFGVGFYSAFLVADRVDVYSRHYTSEEEYLWSSEAKGSFTLAKVDTPTLNRGTRLVLHLKDDQHRYLNENVLREIINTHSQFISYPIYLQVVKTRNVTDENINEHVEDEGDDEPNDDTKTENQEGGAENEKPTLTDVDEDENENENQTEMNEESEPVVREEKYTDFEALNKTTPIWMKNRDSIEEEDYNTFYKSITGDWEDPLTYTHFVVEGNVVFRGILYIPKNAPFDMFSGNQNKGKNIKLYVRRVFITDDCKEFVPDYLSFVKGVVDSDDLPLNISREMLQQTSIFRVMKKQLVKKVLDMLDKLAENKEDYNMFYRQFSKNLKLAVHEDEERREKFAKLLRYFTSQCFEEMTGLDDYVSRMKEGQKEIYYISGESLESVSTSTHLEIFHKKGLEVLFMTEPIDEYCVAQLRNYKGHELVNITRHDLSLPEDETEKQQHETMVKDNTDFCERIKKVLGDAVSDVKVSNRLVGTPCCVSTSKYGWTSNMERIMKAQAMADNNMMSYMSSQKLFEINPEHNIMKTLKDMLSQSEEPDVGTVNLINLLYETALQDAGFSLNSSKVFAHRIYSMVELGMGYRYDPNNNTNPSQFNSTNNTTQNNEQLNNGQDENQETEVVEGETVEMPELGDEN